jgi:hypothetical protein
MAIIENPLSPKDRKNMGNIEYYVRYGKYIIRSKPLPGECCKTPGQKMTIEGVKLFASLYRQIRDNIKLAYAGLEGGISAYRHVLMLNNNKCFIGDSASIDPRLFVLCNNDGSFVNNVVLSSTSADTITGTFNSNAQNAEEEEDPVRAYGFHADSYKIWQFEQSAIRKSGRIELSHPDMSTHDIAVYFECLDRVSLVDGEPMYVIKNVGNIVTRDAKECGELVMW